MSFSIQYCGVLIIAAGQSKRLGQPKQLLQYEGKSLINRLIDIVIKAGNFPITVVLGSNAEIIARQFTKSNLNIVVNDQWEQGMASSIQIGLKQIMNQKLGDQQQELMDGVMILVCDQPFISTEHIQNLLQLQAQTGKPIAACYYAGVVGTPALFHKNLFLDLLSLSGDVGAKKIIINRDTEVAKLHFEKGVIDIDTMDDYQNLIHHTL